MQREIRGMLKLQVYSLRDYMRWNICVLDIQNWLFNPIALRKVKIAHNRVKKLSGISLQTYRLAIYFLLQQQHTDPISQQLVEEAKEMCASLETKLDSIIDNINTLKGSWIKADRKINQ